ncbi:MAG TPA: tRNA lysidine(34) synthetase TilS [Candidatus Saccharimonadales bacterium]|nr:tRNA lysidine(34) synthetase TilS [Candidatus Saccharimonadales bacterium]
MELNVKPGRYVIAVSGGVDSMVLLDLLSKQPNIELIVAHFNHGIRKDSDLDEELVKKEAEQRGLPFTTGRGELGPKASEAVARHARYEFLESVRQKYQADSIITAHHQDDVIETAFINLLRGTGHRGLTAISSNESVVRPLLNIPKLKLVKYAKKNNLAWREDSTNEDTRYLRNKIRQNHLARLSPQDRGTIISYFDKVAKMEIEINHEIATLSHKIMKSDQINREKFIGLPFSAGNELVRYWLLKKMTPDIDRLTIERINTVLRSAKAGSRHSVKGKTYLYIDQKTAHFSDTL